MIRRFLSSFVMVTALLVAMPAQALAVTVAADCGGGGSFSTYGTADNWQDHVHDGILAHYWYYGRQSKTHGWGYEVGYETGTVNGPNLWNAGARCIT